ncbi:MAG: hypothetical protein KJ709_03045, partial [Nanoarchaeota archaeon]|nr:hypothetical protein [Nanoarchaeota archaeon]
MNKKAILLIALLLLSLTACQKISETGSGVAARFGSWKIPLINFVALAVAFVLLQAFAFNVTDQNKARRFATQMAAVVVAGIIAWSLNNTYFWKIAFLENIFHGKVILNIIIVAGGLVVIKELIPPLAARFKERPQFILYILLAVFVGFMVAMAPFKVNDEKVTWAQLGNGANYPMVWQSSNGIKVKYYLLGDSDCVNYRDDKNHWKGGGKYCYDDSMIVKEIRKKNPNYLKDVTVQPEKDPGRFGVLRFPYLWIAIGLSMILAWTFRFLKFTGDGDQGKFAQYGLAIFLAVSMAHEGMGSKAAVQLSEMLLFFLFWRGTKNAGAVQSEKMSGVLSFILVNYITVKTFPDYAIGGWLAEDMTSIRSMIFLIIIALAIGGGLGGAANAVLRKHVRTDLGRLFKNIGANIMHKMRRQGGWLGRIFNRWRDPTMYPEEPRLMVSMRYMFFVLQ